MQKPSLGRVVHYHFAGRDGATVTRPAIVVHVWDDATVNLQVFFDGANDAIGPGDLGWRTSVRFGAPPTDGTGILSPSWTWPPFVAPTAAPKE